jgi:hypothetical protein
MSSIAKIISGGQTGADRGGLDAALDSGVPHGGWCPKGRISEDRIIPERYNLVETRSTAYPARTEANIVDAHCTVVFTFGKLTGGSKKTVALAQKHQRPCLCLDLSILTDEAAARGVLEWLSPGGLIRSGMAVPPPNPVLNVAGSRESKAPGIQQRVRDVMRMALKPPFYVVGAE